MTVLVGVSCYREPASWGSWRDVPAALLPADYVSQVERAGGVAVLLPPTAPHAARSIIRRLDAVILSGGADLDPAGYGGDPHPMTSSPQPARDAYEVALLRAAIDAGLPVLGICRGMQLMAMAAGGTLEQHVPDRVGHREHSPRPGGYGERLVRITEGTRLHAILGATAPVRCHHHQAVTAHPGYAASAIADDGTIEAIEDTNARFRIGVQWHPEVDLDPRLFLALVGSAAARPDPRPPIAAGG